MATTSGQPALSPGHGRGTVVSPLPRSGSRTNPHLKGGAGLKQSKNPDRHPVPLEGPLWTERGQGSENPSWQSQWQHNAGLGHMVLSIPGVPT